MKTITLFSAAALFSSLPAQDTPSLMNSPLPPTVSAATASVPQAPRTHGSGHPATNAALALSPVVVFDRPTENGPLWAMGHDWKASFDGRGFLFIPFFGSEAPHNFPMRLELAHVTVGGQALELNEGQPVATANTVCTQRGSLVEVVHTDLREVEQSFVFETLPNRGALVVEVSMTSELACSAMADGLMFRNEIGNVVYRKAVAVDAAGARLPLEIAWHGTSARIEIPAAFVARAQLPLVLDPVINVNSGLAPGVTQLQREPDVATIETPGSTCVVWRRQYSATDMDCWATILDSNLAPTSALVAIDYTGLSWSAPAVASNTYAQKFLVVSQVDSGAASWISGRMIDTFGIMGAQFDIERNGVVGLPGNKFRPDVGGDPYYGVTAYFTVVFEQEALPGAPRDVYFKQVTQAGALRTTNPIALAVTGSNETNPSISKSNRTANWCVVYQRTASVGDENVNAAEISWFGGLAVAPYGIASQVINEISPHVSSPADIGGYRHFLIAFQRIFSSGNSNIICDLRISGGSSVQNFDLSLAEAGGAAQGWNQILPEVDSDGVRFAVGYTEQWQGLYDYDTRVSTISYSPTTLVWAIDDVRVFLGASGNDEYWTRMAADSGSGSAPSPRYKIVSANYGSNDIQVFDYGGYSPGPLFTTRPMQCGTLSITASGTPALGNPVTFTVGNGALSGTILGFPGSIPLNVLGCNCTQGVVNGLYLSNPLVWTIPPDSAYIGITLSVEGWTVAGSQCLGFVDLSDTIDFTIR